MNLYYILPVVATVLNTGLFILVVWRARPSYQNRVFAAFLACVALWAAFVWQMRVSTEATQALHWEWAIMSSFPATAAFFYRFSVLFRGQRYRFWQPALLYSVAIGFSATLVTTDLWLAGIQRLSYGWAPVMGRFFVLYGLFCYGLTFLGAVNVFRVFRTTPLLEKRNQSAWIMVGVMAALIGLVTDTLPALGVPIYPLGIVGNILFAVFASTAVLRDHLLDINIVIRKGLSYLLMSSLVALPYVGLLLLANALFIRGIPAYIHVLLLLVIAVSLQPLWTWTQRIVDRLFYRERYNYLRALEQFTQQTKSVTELDTLAASTIDLVGKAMQVRNASLMIPSLQTGDWAVVASRGLDAGVTRGRLAKDSPFVAWLAGHGEVLRDRDLEAIPYLQALSLSELEVLRGLQARLYFPLSVRGRLIGLLVLGQKRSGQLFTQDDIHLLSTVSSHLATSLENARLYQVEKQRAGELDTLQQTSARLATELDINLLLQKVAEEAAGLLQADGAAFLRFDEADQTLVLLAAKGLDTRHKGFTVALPGLCPPEWLDGFRDGSTLVVADVKASAIASLDIVAEEDVSSALVIPVVKAGQLLGLIVIFSKHAPRLFTEEEVNMARTFMHHAAAAMENAQLYGIEKEQRLQLEKLDKTKTEFMLAISHELKTPLTAIKSAGELILADAQLDQSTQQGRLFGLIERNTRRLEKRIEELLDFARLQTATLKLDRKPEDINRALEDSVSLSLPTIWSRKQTLETKLLSSEAVVLLDRHRFDQVMFNLLSNASKYSPQGSRITVGTRIEGAMVIVEVADEGVGIAPEFRQKVFEPYFRIETSVSGLGIGLSIVKALVELHGGRVWADGGLKGGTVFSFSLPLESVKETGTPATSVAERAS